MSIRKDPVKKQHVLDFMQALLDNGHAERAPKLEHNAECWYLPLFGVYHPKKRDRIRIVFDSSARYQGLSLNDVLMTGPNLTNSLLGVLMRFRTDEIAVIADLQQMFYCFYVHLDHRNYLRFIWHEDNDLEKGLVDFRMKVHVFGNSPSPAIATFGLRRTADIAEQSAGADVKQFIYRNFYVDDALSSHATSDEAVDLLSRTQVALQDFGRLRLHKICSNSSEVLSAFDKDDLAKDLKDLDFDADNLPMQRSLGVSWNLRLDTFTFNVDQEVKPFTRRGVLSIINGLYDPLGFAAPVTIAGKLLLREAMTEPVEWDEPLPPEIRSRFESWKDGLNLLSHVQIPRQTHLVKDTERQDVFVFSDASEKGIAAVAYMRFKDDDGVEQFRYIFGKAKVAPKHGHTIPRLELCAAVLAVDVFETVRVELDLDTQKVTFFTDSKVVLGYIFNETKRFYVYVRNRVDRIRNSTRPKQWKYVPSAHNPADEATRSLLAADLQDSKWLNGPRGFHYEQMEDSASYALVPPDSDSEVQVRKTTVDVRPMLGSHRFEQFSSWISLLKAMTYLLSVARTHHSDVSDVSNHTRASRRESQMFIIRTVQREVFSEEVHALEAGRPLPKDSKILSLSPYLDDCGVLRVGGRIREANMSSLEMNPIIVPNHHIAVLLTRYFHERVYHQGRTFTENVIRKAGFWLVGGRRLVSSCIFKCVRCRRLRGRQESQKMADLPFARLDPAPPFTYVGIDVFGPWTISTRKTRGGQIHSKRWALIFTCMVIRAVHIEVLEEMSSSCFINALRRFCAIRGEVKVIYSDCGTNFVGSVKDLNAHVINVDDRPVKDYLVEKHINWVFNPPHSSHMGGVWERMIGVARRILDGLLLDVRQLTHEVITTLMAEVSSIINARPLTSVSTDPEVPYPLSPATLLTLKTEHSVNAFYLENLDRKDMYRQQWKCVQHLANSFWLRWKNEYLPTLQLRRKWQQDRKNLQEGDIVLLREESAHRNDWPVGVIVKAHMSDDDCVRKVDVRLGRDGKVFTRPVKEVVVLLSE